MERVDKFKRVNERDIIEVKWRLLVLGDFGKKL